MDERELFEIVNKLTKAEGLSLLQSAYGEMSDLQRDDVFSNLIKTIKKSELNNCTTYCWRFLGSGCRSVMEATI